MSIAYIEELPYQNGSYSLFLDDTCAGSVEVRSRTGSNHDRPPARVYLATIRARVLDRSAPLTSSVQFNENVDGFIDSFLLTLLFPGITIEGDYNATDSASLRLYGNFFDEPVYFQAALHTGLRFENTAAPGASLTGPLAGHPLEQIIQLTLQKYLKRIRIVRTTAACDGEIDFTNLIQQLRHIQHNLSRDILASNIHPQTGRHL